MRNPNQIQFPVEIMYYPPPSLPPAFCVFFGEESTIAVLPYRESSIQDDEILTESFCQELKSTKYFKSEVVFFQQGKKLGSTLRVDVMTQTYRLVSSSPFSTHK